MVALSDRKIAIVKTLVESAPDRIVGGLRLALAESVGDSVLASVRQLVEVEAVDRMLRNTIFQPVTPLCVAGGDDSHKLTFPAQALTFVWRGLKASAPSEIAAALKVSAAMAAAEAAGQRVPDPGPAFNVLLALAAEGLRTAGVREFRTAAELCERVRPGGAEAFAACLDIGPIVRKTLPRLGDWVAQTGDETSAPARLAYKDAVAVAEDAGPRFFEMLASQLDPPWMVLRIISAIMDKPTERYLAESELGGFPERVMADIDESLKAISKLDLDGGREAGREAARRVELITRQTFELEVCIELNREHGWGHRIVGQKKALASLVEGCLRDAEKLTAMALPNHSSGFSRPRKSGPKLDEPPDPKAVRRAITLLSFTHEIRFCANYGGFSAMHTKVIEKLGAFIDHYIEEVLDIVRVGHAEPAIGGAFLAVAADVLALIRDEKAAELVRRRAARACAPPDNTVVLDA
ncbi:hypothetical protein [Phenylobacterium sp.]|jgi:hypothetical protein|uniref:hypothetical protein n=1 Tax=Phenylobacterium sp. TaxID=1871053 RepID=UPI002E376034|nr:hypothetical protein [Phenylobacterium sp.]HEX3367607.1 hypothetical protein [Phenylobacterium sp.]